MKELMTFKFFFSYEHFLSLLAKGVFRTKSKIYDVDFCENS